MREGMPREGIQGIPCTWMRGGTSKGAYFLEHDLPAAVAERDALLLAVMGSPDPRQIDGIGGADPLTSKVAVVAASERPDADVEYLFLQVFVDRAVVTDRQNCGNILAGVAQFAVEKGLVQAADGRTEVAVHMVNSDQVAGVTIETPGGVVTYAGSARIDGVPGAAAPVLQNFPQAAGSTCGALLPTGNAVDVIAGIEATCIDNGMPVVVMRAEDLGASGYESREALDADGALKERLETVRRQAGPLMNLGDVQDKSVPKMTMAAPPRAGGAIATRTFIPHRCHASIRRARGGERRHRLHVAGFPRRRPGAGARRRGKAGFRGASHRRDQRDDARVHGGRSAEDHPGRGAAHGAQAVRGAGLSAFSSVARGSREGFGADFRACRLLPPFTIREPQVFPGGSISIRARDTARVSTTESGFSDTLSIPSSISQRARSG